MCLKKKKVRKIFAFFGLFLFLCGHIYMSMKRKRKLHVSHNALTYYHNNCVYDFFGAIVGATVIVIIENIKK